MKTLFNLIAACLLLASPGGAASADQVTFVLRFAGLKLGSLVYMGNEGPSTYAASMRFQTGGVAGLISNVTFDASSQGRRLPDGKLSPTRYWEETLRDGDQEVTEIVWRGKTPDITLETPAQPDQLDPRQAIGSVDLMTGMHLLLRSVAPEDACRLDTTTYDGKRLMRLSLDAPDKERTGQVTCSGGFSRLKGVAPQGMIDILFGGFDMTYRSLPDGRLRVDRMVLRTPVGRVSLAVE
ncbi:DUF3108 domain-containing protein [Ruegeria pomeroyi]|uniref:DUF3108 domain-containing protein n=1 Tax=Ruegeria pomeroyi TaxID=89184 RepID=A0A9Q3WSC1_9RHOB|nr:DUF3108 domain-containing protein [Ruegeria pomeroyi]MCE8540127.1 DUF3108 domain-containing protein [Ruegeria pomeroyi]